MWGRHLIRSWSKTQGGVTLSSAEAELAGLVKTTGEVLGVGGGMRDLGDSCAEKAMVYADASAALGIAERRGVGSVRHLDTRMLWVQEQLIKELVEYQKVAGSLNPADMGTKHLDAESIRRHMASYDLHEKKGRPGAAQGEPKWGPQVDDDEVANQTAPTAPKAEKEKEVKRVRWKDQVDCGALDLWGGERQQSPQWAGGAQWGGGRKGKLGTWWGGVSRGGCRSSGYSWWCWFDPIPSGQVLNGCGSVGLGGILEKRRQDDMWPSMAQVVYW